MVSFVTAEAPRPWIVDEPVVVNAEDPLLVAFALQHDFRERFLNALQEIMAVEVQGRSYKTAWEAVRKIAAEAMDEDSIMAWMDSGRPLPGLDAEFGEVPRQLTDEVNQVLGKLVRADQGAPQ